MGLLDLPSPLFALSDELLAAILPPPLRLALWGVLAGWLTMLLFRRLSRQESIAELKVQQREQHKIIAGFDGEFSELLPVIRHTLALGMRQLRLSLGPALAASVPVLFIIVWVAGEFGYETPKAGGSVAITVTPAGADRSNLAWDPSANVVETTQGWTLAWPANGRTASLHTGDTVLLELPATQPIPVIHKPRWWNWLSANPIGYLPDDAPVEALEIGLPAQNFLLFGPAWMRGWMFLFFASLLASSLAFKALLKIE